MAQPEKEQEESLNDIYIKDAFLVFRSLCKLSMKTLPAPEGYVYYWNNKLKEKKILNK